MILKAKSELLKELMGEPGGLPTSELWSSVRHIYQPPWDSSLSLAELSAKIEVLSRALPIAQGRVDHLKVAKAKLKSQNVVLSTLLGSLSKRVTKLTTSQLSVALNIVQTIQSQS
jgi:hypothetical protein